MSAFLRSKKHPIPRYKPRAGQNVYHQKAPSKTPSQHNNVVVGNVVTFKMHKNQSVVIPESVQRDMQDLPGIIYFPVLFPILGLPTLQCAYRRFERGTLGVRVCEFGSRLGVLKLDLATYLTNGEKQDQPRINRGKPKNPAGRFGKAGPKTNADKALAGGAA